MQQKALLITCSAESVRGIDELNLHLSRGWRVQHVAPMGGAGGGTTPRFAALVIIERARNNGPAVVEEAEEELDEVIEEMLEGDGASAELDDDLMPPAS